MKQGDLLKILCVSLSFIFLLAPSVQAVVIPNDPRFSFLTPIYDQIGALKAWEKTTGSSNVVVAVLDSGVDMQHPDLRTNIWNNPDERLNGLDDDTNGFVDDLFGWDFIDNDNDPSPIKDLERRYKDSDINHGTIVAGLIGAVGNNGFDASGVAWQVRLMPVRVMNAEGQGSIETVVKGLRYAVANGAQIVNLSFGGPDTSLELQQALSDASRAGVIVVVSAGNHKVGESGDLDFLPSYPACVDANSSEDSVITVGSVDSLGNLSSFSNFGSCVDLVAPGEGVASTVMYDPTLERFKNSFGGYFSGTSLATPLVSGAAVLLKALHPEWTSATIKEVLYVSATPLPQNPQKLGKGLLNIEKATRAFLEHVPLEIIDVSKPFQNGSLIAVGKRVGYGEVRLFNVDTGVVKDLALLPQRGTVKTVNYAFGNDSARFPFIAAAYANVVEVYDTNGQRFFQVNPGLLGELFVAAGDIDGVEGTEIVVSSSKSTDVKVYAETGELRASIVKPFGTSKGVLVNVAMGKLIITSMNQKLAPLACTFTGCAAAEILPAVKGPYWISGGDVLALSKYNASAGNVVANGHVAQLYRGFKGGIQTAALMHQNVPLFAVAPTGRGGSHVKVLSAAGEVVKDFFAFEKNYNGGVSVGTLMLK